MMTIFWIALAIFVFAWAAFIYDDPGKQRYHRSAWFPNYWQFIFLVALAGVVWWVTPPTFWAAVSLLGAPLVLVWFFSLYVLAGLLWSGVKYYFWLNREISRVAAEYRNCPTHEYDAKMAEHERYFGAWYNRDMLADWGFMWPISVLSDCLRLPRRFVVFVYEQVTHIYDGISSYVWRRVVSSHRPPPLEEIR